MIDKIKDSSNREDRGSRYLVIKHRLRLTVSQCFNEQVLSRTSMIVSSQAPSSPSQVINVATLPPPYHTTTSYPGL